MFRTLPQVSLIAICITAFGSPVRGDDPKPEAPKLNQTDTPRGDFIPDGSRTGVQYRKRWAVIIGINYTDREENWGKGPPTLRNAENDARDVRNLLVDYYGYDPACIKFLSGKQATKQAIDGALDNEFLCSKNVEEGDSVLVFFSGHGYARPDPTGLHPTMYIAPADMKMTDESAPAYGTAIEVGQFVEKQLATSCKARHKLLLLDSCFSGSVFRVGVGVKGTRSNGNGLHGSIFKQKAFQAMTAGQENETVLDGPMGGNSPFTAALCRGLSTIPQRGPKPEPFTASELFHTVLGDLEKNPDERQSPECGWIGNDQGEFHFVPLENPAKPWRHELPELNEAGRKQLLALVPSTLGSWWADEMIWFMPGLRHKILDKEEKTRSGSSYLDTKAIREIAEKMIPKNGIPNADYRLRHLNRLLRALTVEDQVVAIDLIIDDLKTRYPRPTDAPASDKGASADRALDLHYLAVLYHKRQNLDSARDCYTRALADYEALSGQHNLRPLYALCCLDYGMLCLQGLNKFEESARLFTQARSRRIVGEHTPVPFVMFTLCKEAEAARRQGKFLVSDNRMKTARDEMLRIDPNKRHPMTGAFLKQDAWACMEQCRFDQARESFVGSQAVFEALKKDATNPYPYLIELLHIQHGLAMIERFQGRDQDAIKQFCTLIDDIAEARRGLDTAADSLPNYAEVKQLLSERYVNSFDRQGDCRLYGRIPDYAEAAYDYRRALRAIPSIPQDRRESVTLDLFYRRAIALAMPSPAQNRKLAKQLCDEAAALERHLREKHKVANLPRKTLINKAIALTLVRDPKKPAENDLWNLIHPESYSDRIEGEMPAAARVTFSTDILDRDEVERLMFGCTLLLRNWKEWGLKELDALACCDQLLAACRAATRPARVAEGLADSGVLHYLRPYYDEAFQFKAEQSPPPVKELVEIAWEATRGKSYRKPKEDTPVLVYYRTALPGCAPQGYFLLDITAAKDRPGITLCVPTEKEWGDETLLRQAGVVGGILPLPDKLSRVLAGLKFDGKLECRWRDPVAGLGMPANAKTSFKLTGPEDPVPNPRSAESLAKFPFNLGSSFPADRFSDLAEFTSLGLAMPHKK